MYAHVVNNVPPFVSFRFVPVRNVILEKNILRPWFLLLMTFLIVQIEDFTNSHQKSLISNFVFAVADNLELMDTSV